MKNLLLPYAFELLEKGYTFDYADGSIIFARKFYDYVIYKLKNDGDICIIHEFIPKYQRLLDEYAK